MNRAELKAVAKQQIKGKIGILFLISLVISIISGLASSIVAPLALLVTAAFSLSTARVYLTVSRDYDVTVKDAFSGFDDFWSAFKVTFLQGLFTMLWSFLFIIPGIIKGISYSMALYILAENKGKSARECIKESMEMTNGHKMELFVLSLSFIGWFFLIGITFGIAAIWVVPYMNTTLANAYQKLKPAQSVEE